MPLGGDRRRRTGNGHPAPVTLLIVEDELLIRLAVCDFLRDRGYRVLEAANAEDAKAIFTTGEPIELLFSDIDLGPGLNGFQLSQWVRHRHPQVRILLASGVMTKLSPETADLSDGRFFSKPYSHEALAAEIRRLVVLSARRP